MPCQAHSLLDGFEQSSLWLANMHFPTKMFSRSTRCSCDMLTPSVRCLKGEVGIATTRPSEAITASAVLHTCVTGPCAGNARSTPHQSFHSTPLTAHTEPMTNTLANPNIKSLDLLEVPCPISNNTFCHSLCLPSSSFLPRTRPHLLWRVRASLSLSLPFFLSLGHGARPLSLARSVRFFPSLRISCETRGAAWVQRMHLARSHMRRVDPCEIGALNTYE